MEIKSYCIYCYTNKVNGKKYIGQSKDISRRCHPSNYTKCTKFYNAIQKYGWDAFEQSILADSLTIEEANRLEELFIQQFNTINEGYNIKSGGLNNEYSLESRQKMSQACKTKQKIICLETGKIYDSAKEIEREHGFAHSNIIACCKGKLHTAYKYHWAYYESYLQNTQTTTTDKRKKSVYCIELNQVFESASEAARQLKLERANISACCAGRLLTTGGYHWKYGN